ncbi:MAG: DeoR family transcriptional regulator [Patescibacteria group bacterium]|jgi:glucan-binding YG repeat protein|nr:DeoR family transcriptional regulator [Patescibacteria group bacterium]
MDKRYFVDLTSKLYRLTFFFPQKEPLRDRIRETSDEILADVVVILEGEIEEKKQAAFKVEKNIKILDVLLDLAKLQNWIEEEKVEIVKNNYLAIKREVEELNDITRRNTKILEPETFLSESNLQQSDSTKKQKTSSLQPRSSMATAKDEAKRSEAQQSQPKTTTKEELPSEKEKIKLNTRQEKIIKIMKNGGKIQIQDIESSFPDVTKRTLRRDISYLVDNKLVKREGRANQTFYQT